MTVVILKKKISIGQNTGTELLSFLNTSSLKATSLNLPTNQETRLIWSVKVWCSNTVGCHKAFSPEAIKNKKNPGISCLLPLAERASVQTAAARPAQVKRWLNVKSKKLSDDTGAAFIRQNSAAEELSSSSRLATKKVTLLTKRSPLSIHLKWDNPDDRESLKMIKKEEGALKLTDGRIAENIQQTSLTYKFKS